MSEYYWVIVMMIPPNSTMPTFLFLSLQEMIQYIQMYCSIASFEIFRPFHQHRTHLPVYSFRIFPFSQSFESEQDTTLMMNYFASQFFSPHLMKMITVFEHHSYHCDSHYFKSLLDQHFWQFNFIFLYSYQSQQLQISSTMCEVYHSATTMVSS